MEKLRKDRLTGESFWMRSWATCTKFLSSCMCFWKRLLSSSSNRSKSLAASSKAWMRPFQERSAGTWGATAELTPVPITRTSSGARLVFRLGSSFLWGRQRLSFEGSQVDVFQILPTLWRFKKCFQALLTCIVKIIPTFALLNRKNLIGPAGYKDALVMDRLCHWLWSSTTAHLGFFALESASWESAAGRFSVFTATKVAIQLL